MNMQNKLYTIQFFSPPNDRFADSPRAVIIEPGHHGFHKFCEFRGTLLKD